MDEKEDPSLPAYAITSSDVTALVSLFNTMLVAMEARIIARLDQNALGAAERWSLHEREHAAHEKAYAELEARLDEHIRKSTEIWAHVREEELREDARIEPIKNGAAWLWANWRTLLLLIVAGIAILGFSGETLDRVAHTLGIQ